MMVVSREKSGVAEPDWCFVCLATGKRAKTIYRGPPVDNEYGPLHYSVNGESGDLPRDPCICRKHALSTY